MAAMLYLPRLFVYHVKAKKGGELDSTLKVMEEKLFKIIMNPAMILALVAGLLMLVAQGMDSYGKWMHAKLFILIFMFGFHGMCSKWRKNFAQNKNQKSEKFYRIANEAPAVLMVIIVVLAVVKPF
ncbi:UNVERIFIED_CONTAM: hypothetical protein GTU68_057328 [Idotea baltica]|nr:hypothetical protein [Idotea baltica]